MTCYVDSSALLSFLFGVDRAFALAARSERLGSSRLLLVECARVIDRYRLEGKLDDQQVAFAREQVQTAASGLHILEITPAVLERAAQSFPTVLGTLDALHLASALEWRSAEPRLVLLTQDRQMATCARALGLPLWEEAVRSPA